MKFYLIFILISITSLSFAQNGVVISEDENATLDNSAIFEVESTNKGMLVPRMGQSQRELINSPANGLLVFQTDNISGFYFYNNGWELLGGSGSAGNNGIPIGTVVAYFGNTAPDGWLLCDGNAFAAGTYPDLATLLGSVNTPDLRGVFLRGIDNGRGFDPDSRTLGSYQEDAFQGHSHHLPGWVNSGSDEWTHSGAFTFGGTNDRSKQVTQEYNDDNINGYGAPRHASETRPKNVAVNYIIKASN